MLYACSTLLQVKIFIIQHSVWCSCTGGGAYSTVFFLIHFFLFPVRGPDAAPAFVKRHTHLCQIEPHTPPLLPTRVAPLALSRATIGAKKEAGTLIQYLLCVSPQH